MFKYFSKFFYEKTETKKLANSKDVNFSSAFSNKKFISNDNLFIENPCVRRSVNLIASSVASLKFKLCFKGDSVFSGAVFDLFNNPNYRETWSSFVESVITNWIIYGNSYLMFSKVNGSFQINSLKPDRVSVIPGEFGIPKGFEYSVDNKTLTFDNDGQLPYIGHFKNFNPKDDWYGLSLLDSVQASASLHQAITTHNYSLVQNGGRPSGVAVLKNRSAPLSKMDKEKLMDAFSKDYQGPNNAGKVIFMENHDFDWKCLGSSPSDMDFVSAKNLAAREISEALGVPAMLIGGVGVNGEASKANFKEVINRFNEATIIPLAERFFAFINSWLLDKIFPGYKLTLDLESFLPLYDKRISLWEKVDKASFLSQEEKREILGFPAKQESVNE